MNLTTLTHPDAVCVQAQYTSRDEAIRQLTMRLVTLGKITDGNAFLTEVFHRESLGPTALGEGLAVPHGKSAVVKEAAFAVATLREPLNWEGVDGPENVELIFLLAIPPTEAGSTHIQVLTELTSRLADETLRARVMAATTAAALLAALDDAPQEDDVVAFVDAPTIVCVTACPAGIAHTYMAAEYLEKAGRKLGVNVVVEKQGANGIEGRLTAQQLRTAQACIIAAEVALKESERFQGIPTLSVPVAEPLRHAEALIKRALALPPEGTHRHVQTGNDVSKSLKTELKQALLSGISFAVPLIVAGGTVLAVAVLLAQMLGLQHLFEQENSWLWMYRKLGGGMLGTLMVPVLAAYTAYSLADKPALASGFAAGLAANMIGSGFLGAIAGGLIAGYLMRWVKNHIRLSQRYNGFLTYYLYPVIGVLGAGSLMLFVIGEPVAWINTSLTAWLNGLSGANALLLGTLLGFMCSFDLGGPVNKAAYAFCLGAMANGVYGPYAIFASVKMVSAFTVTASTMLAPHLFKPFEIETGKSTWLLGLAGITEGAIPMAIEDPLRVIGSFVVGSMATGAIIGAMGIGLSTPGAGIFSLFLLHDAGMGGAIAAAGWFGAALGGTTLSTLILLFWRRQGVKKGKYLTEDVTP
ncbi:MULTISPECIES: PTS 2-O-a-mannosyl-D-glycerate transporter subunit IIABC [Enterobacter cloacae complex]|uniref:PTS 2-O-a-mannosyl-D-glycerate transporter subunit IIABC n=1 Tax=Enterobacter cloacae complex TaxID=354276 RepID=UPI0004536527|nr:MULTISPECIES: PTS 2-O-a-mannosyl-D-glycerate transporter subunit IIABC [Enterobacter cloacae complex]AVP01547.1 PTS 2-O-a-mannosyl-D-glycerate transporter subunit IIABC [Enterobacter cloacae complex sp. FDA-CDC-AR_0132]EUM32312.1 heat-responsive suppressor hrsA [Enterobacter sp. BIDMC 26]MBQ0227309.1 PTS 2-O-a-mannosyl-D-glycerate transporter subunit IIABC [Enterobacter ludwigii]QIN41678.1 PTS 2-O-a-mannosyl-D-glycerate transporter subunit IIABC [Enterobacter ludwigii]